MPLLIQIQQLLPFIRVIKISSRLLHTLICQGFLDRIVLYRKVAHSLVGRQLAGGCVGGNLIIQIAELVNAYQIKGVEQLSAGRVCGVVAVGKLAIVEHHACRGIRRRIIVAACHGAWLIHVGQEGVDGIFNRVRPAESAHDAGLGKWIGLLLALAVNECALTGRGGQKAYVTPARVCGKKSIRIKPCTVKPLEHILAVAGRSGPVHQLMGPIGAAVHTVDAPFLGQQPGQRQIFLWGHIPRQRRDDTIPRRFRRVTVGGIQAGGVLVQHPIAFQKIRIGAVDVMSQHGATFHVGRFAATLLEPAAHHAALVLGTVALGFGQLRVFLYRFRGADRILQPLAQRVEGNGFIRPDLGKAAAAVGNLHLSHGACTS